MGRGGGGVKLEKQGEISRHKLLLALLHLGLLRVGNVAAQEHVVVQLTVQVVV